MVKLYTKNGDSGNSSLFSGKRLKKSDLIFEALGQIDELNALISLVLSKMYFKEFSDLLIEIQKINYLVMATLAGDKRPIAGISDLIKKLEQKIDFVLSKKEVSNRFLLFNDNLFSAEANFLRTFVRKVERVLVSCLIDYKCLDNKESKSLILAYVNRLSDFFFAVSLWYADRKTELVRKA
ncbi:MAG: ATP--cob(I)alamin adenosyltransferase [Patescibacteria group bacterium]|nr:MAG: ATP--cob(I)alamin adenosyltransferase [Patescibacteria group bacterium]